MYNKTLLAELGIEIPKTWDEFMAACQLAKDKGYTGVFIAGKDSRQPANLMDIAATTFLASARTRAIPPSWRTAVLTGTTGHRFPSF